MKFVILVKRGMNDGNLNADAQCIRKEVLADYVEETFLGTDANRQGVH